MAGIYRAKMPQPAWADPIGTPHEMPASILNLLHILYIDSVFFI
jgi:hypothetical protein